MALNRNELCPTMVPRSRGQTARRRFRRAGGWSDVHPRGASAALRAAFAIFAGLFDFGAILAVAIGAQDVYQWALYDSGAPTRSVVGFAALAAAAYVAPNLARGAYSFQTSLSPRGGVLRVLERWSPAFLGALAFAFVTKTTADMSRGATILFYFGSVLAMIATQDVTGVIAQKISKSSVLFARHVFLVGYEDDIEAFTSRHQPWEQGMNIVGAAVLRGAETLRQDLELAAATARLYRPDDIFIVMPWRDADAIEACIDALMCLPAALHIGPERVLDRFSDATISKIGSISSLHLVRRPLTLFDVGLKRLFDLTVASLALVALSPLFLLVALAIKLDSPGPVFFLQRRYGFNQEAFRIVKFRSLTVMEDHAGLSQVNRVDGRVTRVGRFIRRANIDELPQLLNVVMGQMSLVGPRPHVMAHDRMFERSVALAARRHNVKPGISGWAQANGFRGEIDSEEKLRGRIEHDLYYIDNWSFWLDLRILALTLVSPKAYRNAY